MSWTYVESELDTVYKTPPEVDRATDADLPKSERELRKVLADWLMNGFVPVNSFSWFDKWFNNSEVETANDVLKAKNKELIMLLVEPVYMAAFKRILSVMPDTVDHKQLLNQFISVQEDALK